MLQFCFTLYQFVFKKVRIGRCLSLSFEGLVEFSAVGNLGHPYFMLSPESTFLMYYLSVISLSLVVVLLPL